MEVIVLNCGPQLQLWPQHKIFRGLRSGTTISSFTFIVATLMIEGVSGVRQTQH